MSLPFSHCPQGLVKGFGAGSRVMMSHCPLLFSFKTMETCEDGSDLVFFYKLCEGVANASHASHTAAQARLPDKLIARGKEVTRSRCQPPVSELPSAVPAPFRGLGFWAHGISDPYCPLLTQPPPPVPRSQT